jgi:hypothetical protein
MIPRNFSSVIYIFTLLIVISQSLAWYRTIRLFGGIPFQLIRQMFRFTRRSIQAFRLYVAGIGIVSLTISIPVMSRYAGFSFPQNITMVMGSKSVA